jgi:serine/threonine-protein kinase
MLTYDYKPDEIVRAAQDYRVISVLGVGGMGAVYLAEHRELYRNFVIKILRAAFWNRPDLIKMFGAEARTVARLGEPQPHPGIIEVIDLGRTRDRGRMPYMVMPLLTGETLHDSLKRRGHLPVLDCIGLLTRILQALDHAHERGVIHRDVKPHNIFVPQVSEGCSIKVLDWGISKLLEHADNRTSFLGTPAYASREQLLGEGIGPLSDVYSASVVLFRCLTGHLPFEEFGTDFMSLVRSADMTAPLISRYGDFPEELVQLVALGLAKDPSIRPPSALVMAEELQSIGREFRANRDPHTHVTDRIEHVSQAMIAARPARVTLAGIAERTEEDPMVQKWIESQRPLWQAGEPLVVPEGGLAGMHAAAAAEAAAAEAAAAAPITGFESTEPRSAEPAQPPQQVVHRPPVRRYNTQPMPGRPGMREAPTRLPSLVPAALDAPPVRYSATAPMPVMPVASPPPGEVAEEKIAPPRFRARMAARWRWFFGSRMWNEVGRSMVVAGVFALVLGLCLVRVTADVTRARMAAPPVAASVVVPVVAPVPLPVPPPVAVVPVASVSAAPSASASVAPLVAPPRRRAPPPPPRRKAPAWDQPETELY